MSEASADVKQHITDELRPLIDAVKAEGYDVGWHFSKDLMRYAVSCYMTITKPKAEHLGHWRGSVDVRFHATDIKFREASIRSEGTRTVTLRKFEGLKEKVMEKLKEGTEATIRRGKEADVDRARMDEFEARRAKDFEGWKVPSYLECSWSPAPLSNIRPDPTKRQLGRYSIELKGDMLRNLTANQVKALCAFIDNTLPTIQ